MYIHVYVYVCMYVYVYIYIYIDTHISTRTGEALGGGVAVACAIAYSRAVPLAVCPGELLQLIVCKAKGISPLKNCQKLRELEPLAVGTDRLGFRTRLGRSWRHSVFPRGTTRDPKVTPP